MRPRIVLIVPTFPKLSETFIANKFLQLLARGWDVHVACARFSQADWSFFPKLSSNPKARRRIHAYFPFEPRWLAILLLPWVLGWCLLRVPLTTLRYFRLLWPQYHLKTIWQFYQDAQILLLKSDLIHFEFGALAPEKMYLKTALGCKLLVSFRGYDLNFVGLDDPRHYQPVWQGADMLHLLGQDLWRRAQQRGCPAEKDHILIPPAIDTETFSPPTRSGSEQVGTASRPLRVLSVGRLEWKKGYEYAFQAVRLLLDQAIACQYRVVGDGNYFEPLIFARHQLGLTETIELLGAQPQQFVRQQMEWADVFLHAAVSEGFCNAVLEAQAMALPVVTSDADGLGENLQHQVTGFVLPRRNPEALSEKLTVLARDPVLRRQMGAAGRERVEQYFKLTTQIDQFDRLYHRLLERR